MNTAAAQTKILEVIVSSLDDALEAEAGGADRLEVVRDLDAGGLTPDLSLVSQICSSVSIPLRVMLRESSSMQLSSADELDLLCHQAAAFSQLRVNGMVLGFVTKDGIDHAAMQAVFAAAPGLKATFHRAFDALSNPIDAIQALKNMPQVDRILTAGGPGSWASRKLRLHNWQRHAGPRIKLIAGAGLLPSVIADLMLDTAIEEIHIGRAARNPPETTGAVARVKVAGLKGLRA